MEGEGCKKRERGEVIRVSEVKKEMGRGICRGGRRRKGLKGLR